MHDILRQQAFLHVRMSHLPVTLSHCTQKCTHSSSVHLLNLCPLLQQVPTDVHLPSACCRSQSYKNTHTYKYRLFKESKIHVQSK